MCSGGTMENLQPKCVQIAFFRICHKVRLPIAATHRLSKSSAKHKERSIICRGEKLLQQWLGPGIW